MCEDLEDLRNDLSITEWETTSLRRDLDALTERLARLVAVVRALDARVLNLAATVVKLHPGEGLEVTAEPLFQESPEGVRKGDA